MDASIAETKRIILRRWQLGEADRFFDMHRRDEVAQWISAQPMREPGEAEAFLELMRQRHAEDPRLGSWAVQERETGQIAGTVMLKPLRTATVRSRSAGIYTRTVGAEDWRPKRVGPCCATAST